VDRNCNQSERAITGSVDDKAMFFASSRSVSEQVAVPPAQQGKAHALCNIQKTEENNRIS
jgi:hypothetical protein